MKNFYALILSLSILSACSSVEKSSRIIIDAFQGMSLLGDSLLSQQPDPLNDSLRIADYLAAEKEYSVKHDNPDALIWKGRRMAYLGDYKKAIQIFSGGIEKFPEDPRIYRHRGHRYISIRQFDKAIIDLEKAAELIAGTEDQIEPDGIPNSRNTPVSTTHNNIWYHLGLSYYLNNDMANALRGFETCRNISDNPDMYVASSNWVYMILRRMGKEEEAKQILESITADMDVFENMAYQKLLLFYKGELLEKDLIGNSGELSTSNNAIVYGLGNWYYYNGEHEKATEIFKSLIDNGIWAAFGTVAAEADMARME